MRKYAWLVAIAFLSGCTIRTKEPMKEMPKFGSDAKHSTTEGFITGRWRLFIDESTARYHMPEYGKALMSQASEELEFTGDGKVTFILNRFAAHGHWKVNGNGIDLSFDDVDGIPTVELQAKYEKFMAGSRYYRKAHGEDYARGATKHIADAITRIELHEDKKRLLQVTNSTRSDGSTFMGSYTWLRE